MAQAPKKRDQDMFYEAMPATADQYRYAPDDTYDEPEPSPQELTDRERLTVDDTKMTAIVTLILTALVALGLALLFLRGLETIKSAAPVPNSSNTLEL